MCKMLVRLLIMNYFPLFMIFWHWHACFCDQPLLLMFVFVFSEPMCIATGERPWFAIPLLFLFIFSSNSFQILFLVSRDQLKQVLVENNIENHHIVYLNERCDVFFTCTCLFVHYFPWCIVPPTETSHIKAKLKLIGFHVVSKIISNHIVQTLSFSLTGGLTGEILFYKIMRFNFITQILLCL